MLRLFCHLLTLTLSIAGAVALAKPPARTPGTAFPGKFASRTPHAVNKPAACVPASYVDTHAAARASCTFAAGATTASTLGIDSAYRVALQSAITHVIVMMKENRSYDHILGHLADQDQPAAEALPGGFTNLDQSSVPIGYFHQTNSCLTGDPGHTWSSFHTMSNSGAMSGFVANAALTVGGSDGHFVMGTFTGDDLPFYYWLASTFAIDDRHFASALTGTYPNRLFMLAGTPDGVQNTGAFPTPGLGLIFDKLDAAGVTWGAYGDLLIFDGTLNNSTTWVWDHTHAGTGYLGDFLTALDAGTLPQVTFLDGTASIEDEHPSASVQEGEAWTRNVYDHLVRSPLWPSTAMFLLYDEGGGFVDHVAPPTACVPTAVSHDSVFTELGMRVPFIAVSPWAKPHYVSHQVQEHASITRFIEALFDLTAMTARDANSTALLDLFDFGCDAPLLRPPAAPLAGTGGCGGGCTITLDYSAYKAGSGQTIQVTMANCPGGATDTVAVLPYLNGTPQLPNYHNSALQYRYTNGTQVSGATSGNGTVTFGPNGMGGVWPLSAGQYTMYYTINPAITIAASANFTVQ